ncbi:MAG: hypothetical protein ACPF8V_08550, partial [Luteibaculum sp.]
MRVFLLLICLLITKLGLAQTEYQDATKSKIYNFLKDSFDSKYEMDLALYANHVWQQEKNSVHDNNQIDWKPGKLYLQRILKNFLPESFQYFADDIVLYKYDKVWAKFLETGKCHINMGVLINLPTEEAIASFLIHEFAHFKLNHYPIQYREMSSGQVGNDVSADINKQVAHKKREIEAAYLAQEILAKSPYSVECYSDFRVPYFKNSENRETWFIHSKDSGNYVFHWYSTDENRGLYFNQNKLARTQRLEDVSIPEQAFTQLRQEGRKQLLDYYSLSNKHSIRLNHGISGFLVDPQNPYFVFQILECLRVLIGEQLQYSDILSEPFYTGLFQREGDVNSRLGTHLESKSIYAFNAGDVLSINDYERSKIDSSLLSDNVLSTNLTALNYFMKRAVTINCQDCLLSNALTYSLLGQHSDDFYTDYINYSSGKLEDYVKSVLKPLNPEYQNMDGKTAIVVYNPIYTLRCAKTEVPWELNDAEDYKFWQNLLLELDLGRKNVDILTYQDLFEPMNASKKNWELLLNYSKQNRVYGSVGSIFSKTPPLFTPGRNPHVQYQVGVDQNEFKN